MVELVVGQSPVGQSASERPRPRYRRFGLIAALAVVIVSYAGLAIFSQPLGPGSTFGSDRGTWQDLDGRSAIFVDYSDRQTITITASVSNHGPVPVTITGVSSARPVMHDLIRISGARPGVLLVGAVPTGCCALDQAATWRQQTFEPVVISPGREVLLSVRMLMSNCEYFSNLTESIDSIPIEYSVLGFPHTAQVPLNAAVTARLTASDSCPRRK